MTVTVVIVVAILAALLAISYPFTAKAWRARRCADGDHKWEERATLRDGEWVITTLACRYCPIRLPLRERKEQP